jgi:hypothetical protein
MARTGMVDLIYTLRGMADAGTADFSIGAVRYWTDDEIQRVLDRHKTEIPSELLYPVEVLTNGTAQWFDYYSNNRNLEITDGGTAVFIIKSAAGTIQGTSMWSADYINGKVTFTSNTLGSSYFLTGRSYNLNSAAADIWRIKAAHVAQAYDFSTDNHNLSRSQMMQQCMQMANFYAGQAGPTSISVNRGDMLGCEDDD